MAIVNFMVHCGLSFLNPPMQVAKENEENKKISFDDSCLVIVIEESVQ